MVRVRRKRNNFSILRATSSEPPPVFYQPVLTILPRIMANTHKMDTLGLWWNHQRPISVATGELTLRIIAVGQRDLHDTAISDFVYAPLTQMDIRYRFFGSFPLQSHTFENDRGCRRIPRWKDENFVRLLRRARSKEKQFRPARRLPWFTSARRGGGTRIATCLAENPQCSMIYDWFYYVDRQPPLSAATLQDYVTLKGTMRC